MTNFIKCTITVEAFLAEGQPVFITYTGRSDQADEQSVYNHLGIDGLEIQEVIARCGTLQQTIERYYDDYVERLESRREDDPFCPPPLSKADYVIAIEGQLEQCVWDEVKYLAENQDEG